MPIKKHRAGAKALNRKRPPARAAAVALVENEKITPGQKSRKQALVHKISVSVVLFGWQMISIGKIRGHGNWALQKFRAHPAN